jgi:hypothetical protein
LFFSIDTTLFHLCWNAFGHCSNKVTSQASQVADLSEKSKQAYEKLQDIANRAVTAPRRAPYPIPTSQRAVPVGDEIKA